MPVGRGGDQCCPSQQHSQRVALGVNAVVAGRVLRRIGVDVRRVAGVVFVLGPLRPVLLLGDLPQLEPVIRRSILQGLGELLRLLVHHLQVQDRQSMLHRSRGG